MPAYLFTLHAYRSWNPDNPRGFVQEGKGLQAPNEGLARYYREHARHKAVRFRRFHQSVLVWIAFDACARRNWRLHCVATEPTHVHFLVSWRCEEKWNAVRTRLKTLSSLMLGRKCGRPGRKWFSRKGSRKRVRDREHFDYLVNEYLPGHRGLRWRKGDLPPEEPKERKARGER